MSTRVLVLGATGMLGNAVLKLFADSESFEVAGSARSDASVRLLREDLRSKVHVNVDVANTDALASLFDKVQPHVVINCVGLVKQLASSNDPLRALPINSMLPHRLSLLCSLADSRLVNISTDCVFSGTSGNYCENDIPDALDIYGRSKLLGEVVSDSHVITLRTSIIGHELQGAHGLVNWFLSQKERCHGYTKAVFSGLPTVVLAQIIRDVLIPDKEIAGLYHVASKPISKFDLLRLIAHVYGKAIDIAPDDSVQINRSLNADRFKIATGYEVPEWPALIQRMYEFQQ